MDRTLIGILLGSALLIGGTVYYCFPKPPPPIDPSQRHFMHCLSCMKEYPYNQARYEKPCPQCSTGKLVATKESLEKSGPGPNPYTSMIIALVVETNLILGTLLLYFLLSKKKDAEEDFLYTSCIHCHQRLKYRANRIGAQGLCPRCKKGIVFPELEPEDLGSTLPWWKLARWQQSGRNAWFGLKQRFFKQAQQRTETPLEEETE